MKNLKLLFLTLISVISLNLFSQTQVYTSPTSGPNICDGTAVLDTTNINITSIYWQGMGAILQQGNYMMDSLCPGTYGVTFVSNNTPVTLTFVITAGNFNPCLNFGGYITTVDSTLYNGTMTAYVTNGTAPYTYQWNNGVTSPTINNLGSGGYCCYVMDANGCNTTLCDSIGTQSPNLGDTLIITNAGTCNNPIGTISLTVEDCMLDYNAVDTAYIVSIINPFNPLDTSICSWVVVDTNNLYSTYPIYFSVNTQGCYNFQVIVFCPIKSMNYKTLILNQTEYIGFVGIDELSGNSKQLVSVVDLMGKEVSIQPNKFLIYTYSDGSKEIKYITE
jgi:hypothetical protein